MKNSVPVLFIPSNVCGLLGIMHLTRLWQKGRMKAAGLLPEGYTFCDSTGFDGMFLKALNLDPAAVSAYLLQEQPDLPVFEAWIKTQPDVKLDDQTISTLNAEISAFNHEPDTIAEILEDSGLTAEGCPWKDACRLNMLQDLKAFSDALKGEADQPEEAAPATGPEAIRAVEDEATAAIPRRGSAAADPKSTDESLPGEQVPKIVPPSEVIDGQGADANEDEVAKKGELAAVTA